MHDIIFFFFQELVIHNEKKNVYTMCVDMSCKNTSNQSRYEMLKARNLFAALSVTRALIRTGLSIFKPKIAERLTMSYVCINTTGMLDIK